MEFKEKQAIYLQIGDYILEQVLLKKMPIGEKIPSIRDLAVALEVNPNTVQRTYDYLQQRGIIQTKRGLGYFVDENAEEKILMLRRQKFEEVELPLIFKNMHLLELDLEEFIEKYRAYIKNNF